MSPDGTDAFTPMTPETWKASLLAKKGSTGGGFKAMSPDEWASSYKAKKSGGVPDASKMTQAEATQKLEGGGLQAPTVDPIDIATFGAAGGAMGAVKGPAEAALNALREAGTVAASEVWNKATGPLIQKTIPGTGTGATLARNVAQTASGFVPFAIAGAGPQAAEAGLRKAGGEGQIAEQGVKAGAEAGAKAEKAQTAMADTQAKAQTELDQKYSKFRDQQVPGAKEEARHETVTGTVGQAPSATMEQGPERIARNEQFRDSVTAPLERWRSDWAVRRNKLLESKADTVVDDGPLQTAVTQDESQWQPNARPYSPAAVRLIGKVKALGAETDPLAEFFPPEELKKLSPRQRQNYLDSLGRAESSAKVESYRTPSPQAVAKQATEATPRTRPKVPELISLQSEANALARNSKGADRTLALKVVHGIDDSFAGADINVPAYKKIQAEYRDHRLHFPYKFEDAIQGTARPVDTANQIFAEPERALDLANLSNEAEKQDMRQLYGQWIAENGTKAVTKEQQPFLSKLYPNSPLAKPDAWVYLDKAEQHLGDVFENAPLARKKFLASLENQRAQLLADNSKESVDIARKLAKTLGPTGDRILAKIDAAKTPEEQAKIAYQEFGALRPSEEGQATGVKAIQTASTPQGGLMGRLKHRAEIYGILALSGRPYFVKLATVLGVGTGIHEMLKAAVTRSLRDPAAATKLYRAYIEPGAASSMDTITRNIVTSAMSAEVAQVGQAITAKPGPMVTHIEHEKAKAIAGPRGAVSPERISRIEDLNKDVAKGDAPEVHADLRTGRLTHTDLARIVQPDKPGLAALFQGMSPQQAVDAFAVADPSERELALPALAQHIQDGSKQDPKSAAIAMQRLKSIMAQPEGVVKQQEQGVG